MEDGRIKFMTLEMTSVQSRRLPEHGKSRKSYQPQSAQKARKRRCRLFFGPLCGLIQSVPTADSSLFHFSSFHL
jgi:hypothetical protein